MVADGAQNPPALAVMIACRSEPGPLSAVLVTTTTTGGGALASTVNGSAGGVPEFGGVVTRYTESLRIPTAVGVEVISNVQDALGASIGVIKHWLDARTLNPAPPPVNEMLLIEKMVPDVLVNVPCKEDEVTPCVCMPKLRPAAGAYVALAPGVTLFEAADDGLVPTAFVAVTVKVYGVPLVRPVTMIGPPVADPVMPPGEDVAEYVKIIEPPLNPGGVYETVALPLPAIAEPMVGAPGMVVAGPPIKAPKPIEPMGIGTVATTLLVALSITETRPSFFTT